MKTITIIMAIIILAIGCAHSPNTIQIQENISEFDDVDTFVTWLEEQPNIYLKEKDVSQPLELPLSGSSPFQV